jgi:hypothetical protein
VPSLREFQDSAAPQAIERDPRVVQRSGECEAVQETGIELRHTRARGRFRIVIAQ